MIRKYGGIWFVRVWRLRFSFCVARTQTRTQAKVCQNHVDSTEMWRKLAEARTFIATDYNGRGW